MCNDKNYNKHVETRLSEIQDVILTQKYNYNKYLILYNFLIFTSLISSLTIPVLEMFCPVTVISCIIAVLGLLSSASVGLLSKFNINSKKDKCKQNIFLLKQAHSEGKRTLLYKSHITQVDMEKLFQKLDFFI